MQLAQNANQLQQHAHPKGPKDLDFDLAENFLPEEFLCRDIAVDNHHHLLFATEKMIDILSHAKHWFIDATFKIVRYPFTQLLSIHAFIKSDDSLKQVPLMFAIMSEKCKRDYRKVLKAVKNLLPSIAVQTVTTDFEAAMWQALSSVLPQITTP